MFFCCSFIDKSNEADSIRGQYRALNPNTCLLLCIVSYLKTNINKNKTSVSWIGGSVKLAFIAIAPKAYTTLTKHQMQSQSIFYQSVLVKGIYHVRLFCFWSCLMSSMFLILMDITYCKALSKKLTGYVERHNLKKEIVYNKTTKIIWKKENAYN